MEVIKIDRSRLKVMLTADDLDEYALDYDALENNDAFAGSAFRSIMREAKVRCGFDAEGGRVFVQVFPSKGGGCELFVTVLGDGDSCQSIKTVISRRRITYKFDSLDALLGFCTSMKHAGYRGRSSAYYDAVTSKYYVCYDREIPIAGEFGGRITLGNAELFLREHCKKISSDAVSELGDLA